MLEVDRFNEGKISIISFVSPEFDKIKIVKGFTTNPSLMKKEGVEDYKNFYCNK